MAHDGDGVETAISLAFESVHKTVQIDSKVVPAALLPLGVGTFNKEGFNFEFVVGRGNHYSAFGLHYTFEYFIEVRKNEFHAPLLSMKEVDLEHNILLDKIKVFFVLFGKNYLAIR